MLNVNRIYILIYISLLFISCKKSYTCTCTSSASTAVYTAIMQEYQSFVQIQNNPTTLQNSTIDLIQLEKTSRSSANALCSSSERKNTYEVQDDLDADNDLNYLEKAYRVDERKLTECSLEKK